MKRITLGNRVLGIVCLTVAGGDALMHALRLVKLNEPAGLLVIPGVVLVRFGPSSARAARLVIVFSGIALAFTVICFVAFMADSRPHFPSPATLAAIIAGATAFILWGLAALKKLEKIAATIRRIDEAASSDRGSRNGVSDGSVGP
jgi:hypothetical protein